MRLSLVCSDSNRKSLMELLTARGILIDDTASVTLLERGLEEPKDGLVIIFDSDRFDPLLAFFEEIQSEGAGEKGKAFIIAKRGDNFELLRIEEILYFFADGNFVYCQARSGRLEVRKKLYALERELTENGFVRVNKSHLINIMEIHEIIPWFAGRLLLKLKGETEEIEVSRSYVRSFKDFLGM